MIKWARFWGLFAIALWLNGANAVEHQGIIYSVNSSLNQITRYSLPDASFIDPIPVGSSFSALHVDDSGIYFANATSVIHTDHAGGQLSEFIQLTDVTQVMSLGEFLIVKIGLHDLAIYDKATGSRLDTYHNYFSIHISIVEPYSNSIIIDAYTDIVRLPIDENGHFGTSITRPGSPNDIADFQFYAHPDKGRFITDMGDIYNSTTLSLAATIEGRFDDMAFWHGLFVVLRGGVVYGYNKTFNISGSHTVQMAEADRIHLYGQQVFIFSADYSLVEIFDINLLDMADPDVPLDPNNLAYFPDNIVLSQDGNTIYLVSNTYLTIFRWSVSQRAYIDSIPLTLAPANVSLSANGDRLYLSYREVLNYIDLASGTEHNLLPLPPRWQIHYVIPINDILFVQRVNTSSSGKYYGALNLNGDVLDYYFNVSGHPKYIWDPAKERLYFAEDYAGGYVQLDASTGIFGNTGRSSNYSGQYRIHPMAVSENGAYVVYGYGQLLETVNLQEIGQLSTDIPYRDIIWKHGNVFTLSRSTTGTSGVLQRWQPDLQPYSNQMFDVPGTPIKLLSSDQNNNLIVIYSINDIPQFEVLEYLPVDFDMDGYLDTVDLFPADATEWTDWDLDGIGDNADPDDDNDTVNDLEDAFPLDPEEWEDTDLDGQGNNADLDDDNDGVDDVQDYYPLDSTRWQLNIPAHLPLYEGSYWLYTTLSGDAMFTLDTPLAVANQVIRPVLLPNGSRLYVKADQEQIRFYGVYLPEVDTGRGVFSVDVRLNQGFPLLASGYPYGDGQIDIQPGYCSIPLNWHAQVFYSDRVQLTVPAGTFETLHSELYLYGTLEIEGETLYFSYHIHLWFAENLGIVKMTSNEGIYDLTDALITDNDSEPVLPDQQTNTLICHQNATTVDNPPALSTTDSSPEPDTADPPTKSGSFNALFLFLLAISHWTMRSSNSRKSAHKFRR